MKAHQTEDIYWQTQIKFYPWYAAHRIYPIIKVKDEKNSKFFFVELFKTPILDNAHQPIQC